MIIALSLPSFPPHHLQLHHLKHTSTNNAQGTSAPLLSKSSSVGMRARLVVTTARGCQAVPSSSSPSLLSISRAIRCQSTTTATSPPQQSEAGKPHAHLRQYLDAWMGSTGTLNTPSSTTTTPSSPTSPHQHHHARPSSVGHPIALTVAGKSYLVPTLRLPRGVSPTDLQAGLRATTSLSAGYFKSAPIVVDLGEWMTSQPLPRGGVRTEAAGKGGEVLDAALLGMFVEALREAGLHPVGISNATATDVQAAAMALGLPCFMGRHGNSSSGSTQGSAAAPAVAAPAAPVAAATTASSSRPARKPTMAAAHLPSIPPPSAAPPVAPFSPKAVKASSSPSLPPSPSTSVLPTKVNSSGRHLPCHLYQNTPHPSLPLFLPPSLGDPRQRPHRATSSSQRRNACHPGACQIRSRSVC